MRGQTGLAPFFLEPIGSLLTVTLGAGDTQSFTYDPNTGRMTGYSASVGSSPTVISGAPQWSPNGTLLSNNIVDGYNPPDTQVCSYLYDDFIRVAGTTTPTAVPGVNCVNGLTKIWNQTFTYGSDAFGNLTKTTTGPGLSWACAACYNTANNQYNSTLSASIAYDAAGNLLNDTFHSYTWDAYGHVLTIATPPNGSTTSSVVYDANGNKVEENVSGATHEYVSAFGVTAQMTGQTEASTIVSLPGGVQALYSGGTLQRFRYPDWQGSIRAESDPVARTFTESLAFAPFGERYVLKGAPYNVDSFTGKPDQLVPDEYDFPAREEHNGQGRWVSPDPMRGTGNKYVYADNNPLSKVDIYGMYTVSIDGIDTSVDGAIEAAAFSIAESHPTFAVQVGSQATTTHSSGNDSSSSSTQTASGQQQAQAQAAQNQGQAVQEAQNLIDKAKAAGTATVNAISDVSDYLNDHPFLALALTLGGSAEKDEPAIEQIVDETASSLETKIEDVEQEIGTVFRSGGSNPGNLTMREGEDALSFRDSLSNPIDSATNPVFRPGSKYIAVDSSKLPDGTVVRDNMPPGHVSMTASPEQIKNAIIDRGKLPQ